MWVKNSTGTFEPPFSPVRTKNDGVTSFTIQLPPKIQVNFLSEYSHGTNSNSF